MIKPLVLRVSVVRPAAPLTVVEFATWTETSFQIDLRNPPAPIPSLSFVILFWSEVATLIPGRSSLSRSRNPLRSQHHWMRVVPSSGLRLAPSRAWSIGSTNRYIHNDCDNHQALLLLRQHCLVLTLDRSSGDLLVGCATGCVFLTPAITHSP